MCGNGSHARLGCKSFKIFSQLGLPSSGETCSLFLPGLTAGGLMAPPRDGSKGIILLAFYPKILRNIFVELCHTLETLNNLGKNYNSSWVIQKM